MKIDTATTRINIKEACLHFYLNGVYLGMLTYGGELSDFRAVVRKKMNPLACDDLMSSLGTAVSLMVRYYLDEQTTLRVFELDQEMCEVEEFYESRLRKTADRLIALGYVR
jgi:hypothetical protein